VTVKQNDRALSNFEDRPHNVLTATQRSHPSLNCTEFPLPPFVYGFAYFLSNDPPKTSPTFFLSHKSGSLPPLHAAHLAPSMFWFCERATLRSIFTEPGFPGHGIYLCLILSLSP